MAKQEIERKFLVKASYKEFATKEIKIVQGFLSTVPERTVRIRIKGDKAYITIKGIGNKTGVSRYEFEKIISLDDAKDLLAICEPGIIDKTRYIIPAKNGLFFEVDEFYGENEGLTIAEIELPSEDTPFHKPNWLGKEVTGEVRYYNAMLVKKPFKSWKQKKR
jgi:adenylate cyclase